jgi:hypothetical protein
LRRYWPIGVAVAVFLVTYFWYSRVLVESRQSAVFSQSVVVSREARSQFFEAVTRFSKQQGFKVRIAAVRPDNEHFAIYMDRADFSISAANAFDTSVFRVFYYVNEPAKVTSADVTRLASDFEKMARSVDSVTVSAK